MATEKKTWEQMSKGERIAGMVGLCIAVIIGIGLIGGFVSALTGPHETPPPKQQETTHQPVTTYKDIQETEAIPFGKKTRNDSTRDVGTSAVTTTGVDGIRTKTFHVTYVDGKETARVQTKSEVTLKPVTQVTSVGTRKPYVPPAAPAQSSCNPNYSGCVPNVPYDLDCADIGHSVMVTGYDEYGLDRDNDGYGCESY